MLVHGAITITYVHASTLIQVEGACVHSNKIMHNICYLHARNRNIFHDDFQKYLRVKYIIS